MSTTFKLLKIHARDVLRSRWLGMYAGFFLLLTEALLRFSGSEAKAILALGTLVVIVVPLITIVLATVYAYGARAFLETLLAQPVRRTSLFTGLYLGLALPMAGAFVAGVCLPLAMRGFGDGAMRGSWVTLLLVGVLLTLSFTALANWIAFAVDDRLRGLSLGIAVWLLLGVLYDGIVLTIVATLADRPLEKPLLVLMFANPVDLGRVLLLLKLDVAALMGYTGAAFQRFFAGAAGGILAAAALALWTVVPAIAGARRCRMKDF